MTVAGWTAAMVEDWEKSLKDSNRNLRDGRMHIQECSVAMDRWREAWNASPVPYPLLKERWRRVAKKCGCGFGGWG